MKSRLWKLVFETIPQLVEKLRSKIHFWFSRIEIRKFQNSFTHQVSKKVESESVDYMIRLEDSYLWKLCSVQMQKKSLSEVRKSFENLHIHESEVDSSLQNSISKLKQTSGPEEAQEILVELANMLRDDKSSRMDFTLALGIPAVLSAMVRYQGHVGVQREGVRVLNNVAANEEYIQNRLLATGGIQAIITAMNVHKKDARIQFYGCAAFVNMSGDQVRKTEIVKSGAIPVVIAAIQNHKKRVRVPFFACWALGCLSSDEPENSKMIAAAGGIQAILSALKCHDVDAGVQKRGLWALEMLAVGNSDNVNAIVALEGIQVVLSSMEFHACDARVQHVGCNALGTLASSTENQRMIETLKGIETVLSAMSAHNDKPYVQASGSYALRNFIRGNGANRVLVAQNGGIDLILSGMKKYVSHASVQRYGSAALAHLAHESCNQVRIAAAGGIQTILSAMSNHRSDARVQQACCCGLHYLALNNVENKMVIRAAGGVDAILCALDNHTLDASVFQCGLCGLYHLASGCATSRGNIVDAGGIQVVISAMEESHRAHAGVQIQGCNLLIILSSESSSDQATIAFLGGIDAVLAAIFRHEEDRGLQHAARWLLRSLAFDNDENQRRIQAAGFYFDPPV